MKITIKIKSNKNKKICSTLTYYNEICFNKDLTASPIIVLTLIFKMGIPKESHIWARDRRKISEKM